MQVNPSPRRVGYPEFLLLKVVAPGHGSGEYVDSEGEEKAPPATACKPAKNESVAP
jgi:hypothetical protein